MVNHKAPTAFPARALFCIRRYFAVLAVAIMVVPCNLPLAVQADDGNLDATFGSGGKVITDFSGNFDVANDVLIQPDGKIVVSGGSFKDDDGSFALARYNSDGSLDGSFGDGGAAVTDFLDVIDVASSIAFQKDGEIVAAGTSGDETTRADFVIARYNNVIPIQYDTCIMDDDSGSLFQFDSKTGDYKFTVCNAVSLTGKATLKVKGCKTTLRDAAADRDVSVTIKPVRKKPLRL